MKKLYLMLAITITSMVCTSLALATGPSSISNDTISQQAQDYLKNMSLEEKVGQKLMLDFRNWCEDNSQPCSTQDLTVSNSTIETILNQNHIGGVILFANNLKNIPQIIALTDAFQSAMGKDNLPLLIGTDQEGGIVTRLPRDVSVTFPGNMAMAAAFLGHPEKSYIQQAGKMLADDLKAVGINVDFAPDVDVNSNPMNPIINVRSFSDDPKLVAELGLQFSRALQQEGIASSLKHFPGHGDTATDSHTGLPIVNHDLAEAHSKDLYPFQSIIQQQAPDMIMTAHIQFPALDASQIHAGKKNVDMTVPATLSRKIQHDILRGELNYQGVVITDALNMGAISQNFDATDAVIKAFQAGDDIALMPVVVATPKDSTTVKALIDDVVKAVKADPVLLDEVNQSVLRILKLKIKLGLLNDRSAVDQDEKVAAAQALLNQPEQRALEAAIADSSITLVQNNNNLLPIKLQPGARIHILTPWQEQGAGIAHEIEQLQKEGKLPANLQVTFVGMGQPTTDLEAEKIAIDNADLVIVGNLTHGIVSFSAITGDATVKSGNAFFALRPVLSAPLTTQNTLVFPDIPQGDSKKMSSIERVENSNVSYATTSTSTSTGNRGTNLMVLNEFNNSPQLAYQALLYAKSKGKSTIFISLLAPYDLPNYKGVADVMLAGYDFYGYLVENGVGYYRGPSMPALARVIFGISAAVGKLPIDVPDTDGSNKIIYPRGYSVE